MYQIKSKKLCLALEIVPVASLLEHEQILPKPGWVEHDPIEIVRNTDEVIQRH